METKLLFLVTEDWYFVSHRLSLAIASQKDGFDVAVATRVREKATFIREAGIRLIPFEMDRRSMNPLKEAVNVVRFALMLRREKPDLLHLVALKPIVLGAGRAPGGYHPCRVRSGRHGLSLHRRGAWRTRYALGEAAAGNLAVPRAGDRAEPGGRGPAG